MQAKKKIMILINTLMHGGAERIVFDIADKINKENFDLHIVYMKDHKYFKEGNKKSFLDDLKNVNVKISCLGGKNKDAIRESIALWKLLRIEKPDVLHTFLPYAGTIGRIVGKLAGVKSVLAVQCNLKMAQSSKTYWLDRITLPLVDSWTAATEWIEEEYNGKSSYFSIEKWQNGRRHFTVLAGVDVDDISKAIKNTDVFKKRSEIGIKDNNQVVSMCARMVGWKGHGDLINAFSFLPQNVELVLIGGGQRMEEFQNLAKKLSVFDRVHFLGDRDDLLEILAISDVYVQSYTRSTDGTVWKGPNTSQMIAGASKISAVSTSVPMIEHFMQDGISGKIADLNNPEDLAKKIKYLLDNKDEAKKMAENAFEIVSKNYSLKSMLYSYENIYKLL